MSLDLSGLWNGRTHNLTSGQARGLNANESGKQVTDAGSKLAIGNILSGKVTQSENGVIQIQLSTGECLQGKLDEGITFGNGSNVTFEVSGISDSQVVLKALFQNTNNMNTINKALSEAGIEQNGESVSMVNAMMEDGMAIDKASIQNIYRQVLEHPHTDSTAIVSMNHLQIETTPENVRQFGAYMNLEHQISTSVERVAQTITDTYMELMDTSDEKALHFMKQMVEIFSTENSAENNPLQQLIAESDNKQVQNVVVIPSDELMEESFNKQLAEPLNQPLQQTKDTELNIDGQKWVTDERKHQMDTSSEATNLAETEKQSETVEQSETADLAEVADHAETELQTLGGLVERRQLTRALGALGLPENLQRLLLNGHMSDKEILNYVKTIFNHDKMQSQDFQEKALKLCSSKGFQKVLQEQVRKQWLLEPQNVKDHEGIEEFYSRLKEQTGRLTDNLTNLVRQSSELYKEVTNIRENVDFMNQLNQTANYVQLPLRLQGEATHGDLYVYKNKNTNQNDGTVSAFLHLDMENLGPVDVFVALKENNLSTNFYLKNDSMIDFIEENISLLNDRLEKKGFRVNTKISLKEKKVNVMQEIVSDHKEERLLSKQSFDMRA